MPLIFVKNESKKMETLSGIYRCDAQPWWLVGGISPTQVAAVYQPRWARNEADSLLDLSGNGRNLLKIGSPTWSAANGWNIPAGGNHGYDADVSHMSAIVRFSGRTAGQGACLLSRVKRWIHAGGKYRLVNGTTVEYYTSVIVARESDTKYSLKNNIDLTAGVYAANFVQERLWINGVQTSFDDTTPDSFTSVANRKLIGQASVNGIYGSSPVNILAVAFYSIQLTAEQHATLYQSIMNI